MTKHHVTYLQLNYFSYVNIYSLRAFLHLHIDELCTHFRHTQQWLEIFLTFLIYPWLPIIQQLNISKKTISNQMWHELKSTISWDQKRSADRIRFIRGVSRSDQRWNPLTYIIIKKCHQHKDVNIAMDSLLSPSTTDLIFSSSNTSSIPWYFWIDTV